MGNFPWTAEKGKVARLICDIYNADGTPFDGDPRNNLKRVLKEMEALGFSDFNLGPEPEFFLFKVDEKGNPTLELNDNGGYFDLAPMDLGKTVVVISFLNLKKWDLKLKHLTMRLLQGKDEIDFKYANAIRSCDDIQTFKLVVKQLLVNMVYTQRLCQNHYTV